MTISTEAVAQEAPPPPPTCNPTTTDCRLFPAAKSIDEAFLHLQLAINALNERMLADPKVSVAAITALQAQTNELQDLFATGQGPDPSPDYIANLDFIATLLLHLASEPDTATANRALDLVQRDFQVKLSSARAAFGGEGTKPSEIPVRITTRRGTQPVHGYTIRATELLFAAYPSSYGFNNTTSPATSRTLTPGVYMVYVFKNGVKVAEKEFDIGLAGENAENLFVDVP